MDAVAIIRKKRDGEVLKDAEIEALIKDYTAGEVADYQMAAFCMAVFFRGMTPRETTALTLAMARSGDQADLSGISGRKVDKHSTGGVADTTTLVLGPLVAACGVPVAKMSGRGLGHTGGTIDKLEAIPGFRVSLDRSEFFDVVNKVGLAVVGQTQDLAPADKKLYALRDVTATVDALPLIASSIMSKKIAGGADAIVLDVKCGSGAFMKTPEAARALGEAMVDIGKGVGRTTVAVISDMNQPLGRAIGNSLEIVEAIETLRGGGPPRLVELCVALGSEMLVAAGAAATAEEARMRLRGALASGAGLAKMREWIQSQGGDPVVVDDPGIMGCAPLVDEWVSPSAGYVAVMNAEAVGHAAMLLGAGRQKKEDVIDLQVGIEMLKESGDPVVAGEPICRLHGRSESQLAEAKSVLARAIEVFSLKPQPAPLVYEILR